MSSIKAFPRHSVVLSKDTLKAIAQAIKENGIIEGKDLQHFESEFSRYIGVKYAQGASSARFLLYLALKALHIQDGDEIILPAYTFYALPLIIKLFGAKPLFVDVDERTYNINTSLIEEKITKRSRAILITHMFGQPCEMDSICSIARSYNLKIIEDCAHACGAKYRNRKVGSFGDVALFSFQMGKNLPCFGGGMAVTNDKAIYENIKWSLSDYRYPSPINLFKKVFSTYLIYLSTRKYLFPYLIYPFLRLFDLFNFDLSDRVLTEKIYSLPLPDLFKMQGRLANLQAKVGLAQLNSLDVFNEKTRQNAELLTRELKEAKNIFLPFIIPEAVSTFLHYRIKVNDPIRFRGELIERGIDTKKDDMTACSSLEIFRDSNYMPCPVAEGLPSKSIEIPNNPFLNERDILYIAEQVWEVSKELT